MSVAFLGRVGSAYQQSHRLHRGSVRGPLQPPLAEARGPLQPPLGKARS